MIDSLSFIQRDEKIIARTSYVRLSTIRWLSAESEYTQLSGLVLTLATSEVSP